MVSLCPCCRLCAEASSSTGQADSGQHSVLERWKAAGWEDLGLNPASHCCMCVYLPTAQLQDGNDVYLKESGRCEFMQQKPGAVLYLGVCPIKTLLSCCPHCYRFWWPLPRLSGFALPGTWCFHSEPSTRSQVLRKTWLHGLAFSPLILVRI